MMFSIPAFQSLNPFLAIITAALLLASAFAAPTPDQTLLNAPLNGIKSAAEGVGNTSTGDCAGQKPLFDAAFKEATALAQNALRAIDQVKIGRDNWIAFSDETRISASLQALFGVKAGAFREPMAEWDKGRSESVMRE